MKTSAGYSKAYKDIVNLLGNEKHLRKKKPCNITTCRNEKFEIFRYYKTIKA